jgi:hypothetical protein
MMNPDDTWKELGWLEEGDPFFAVIDEIVAARFQHRPRVVRALAPPTPGPQGPGYDENEKPAEADSNCDRRD